MAWTIEVTSSAERQLRKLDRRWQRKILDHMEHQVAGREDPRMRGKALAGDKKGLWRYRVGDYRVLCQINDGRLVILVIAIGHRNEVYR